MTLHVAYAPAGWYVWAPSMGPGAPRMPHKLFPAVGRTPAEALAAIRRTWPDAPAGTVRHIGDGLFSPGDSAGGIDQAENGYFQWVLWPGAPSSRR